MNLAFALPTPVFRREAVAGMKESVVMPKKRSEVVADRERRMTRVVDGEVRVSDSAVMEREVVLVLDVVDEVVKVQQDRIGTPRIPCSATTSEGLDEGDLEAEEISEPPAPTRTDARDSAPTIEPVQATTESDPAHRPQKPRAMSLTFALAAKVYPVVPSMRKSLRSYPAVQPSGSRKA